VDYSNHFSCAVQFQSRGERGRFNAEIIGAVPSAGDLRFNAVTLYRCSALTL
jgi:hypothetical protein